MAISGLILLWRAVGMTRLSRTILALGLLLGLAGSASAQSGCGGQFGGGSVCANKTGATGLPGPTASPILGIPGTSTGQLGFAGAGGGTATVKAQPAAGTPSLLLPTTSGTFPSTAAAPLVLDPVTGALTCPTCGSTGRTLLSADTTFWRRSDGSNTLCNGTANASAASAPNCAYVDWNPLYIKVATVYDGGGHTVTLKSGTQDTVTSGLAMNIAIFGTGSSTFGGAGLFIDLNGSNIAEATTKGIVNNVVSQGGITIQNSAGLGVGGNISSAGFACVQASFSAMGIGSGISTGPCFDAAYEAIQGGEIAFSAPVNSIGGGGNSFILAATGGLIGLNGQTINILANQTYTTGFASADSGRILANSATFPLGGHTVTGPRYSVVNGGSIYTAGGGGTFFPGTSILVSTSGGLYDAQIGINTLAGIGTIIAPNPLIFQTNGGTNAGIITSAQRWGFGSTTGALVPTNTRVVISENVSVVDAATPGLSPLLHLVGADSALGSIVLDGFGQQVGFGFRKASGTAASKTAVTTAPIGSFFGIGWDTSVYAYGPEIDLLATQTWTASAHGSGLAFYSVVNGTTTQINSMTLQNSGGLSIGTSTDPGIGSLQLNAQQFMPNITTTSAAQTGTVCWTTGTGKFTVDTTVGCLTSLLAAKDVTERLAPAKALDIVARLEPFAFRYKNGWGDSGHYEQFGLGAEEVALVDERLVGRDPDGALQGVRYQELGAVLVGAIKELRAEIRQMKGLQ